MSSGWGGDLNVIDPARPLNYHVLHCSITLCNYLHGTDHPEMVIMMDYSVKSRIKHPTVLPGDLVLLEIQHGNERAVGWNGTVVTFIVLTGR